jgi:RNA-binding protein PNO1
MSNTRILAQYHYRSSTKTRSVDMQTSNPTIDTCALQKGGDVVSASTLEFEVQDTFALLQLDDLFIGPFHAADVKSCEAAASPA